MMKIIFARMICVAALWPCCTVANAQPFRKLTVDDFRGNPSNNGGGVVAYTHCSIDYRYAAHREKDYYILNFTILLQMNNDQSWMDRKLLMSPEMAAEILKHEQGHYNIAYLEQQELLRTVSRTVFRDNYQTVAREIFNRIDAKYQQLNQNYDVDTQHSTNLMQQHSWDLYF
jgi:hypothetical protein